MVLLNLIQSCIEGIHGDTLSDPFQIPNLNMYVHTCGKDAHGPYYNCVNLNMSLEEVEGWSCHEH